MYWTRFSVSSTASATSIFHSSLGPAAFGVSAPAPMTLKMDVAPGIRFVCQIRQMM
jgi:hypothetical protein